MNSFLNFFGLGKTKTPRETKSSKDLASNTYRRELQAKLYDLILEKQKGWVMNKFNPFMIKKGDTVILNKYSLLVSSSNGWDGGAKSLLNLIKGNESYNVVYATVDDVILATSLFTDRIFAFVDNHTDEELHRYEINNEIVSRFNQWWARKDEMNKSNSSWRDVTGLYVDVMFTLHDIESIKPKWGLNSYSFIPLESQLGKKTEEFWKRENELQKNLEKTRLEQKLLEENIVNLYKELHGR
jgi:hypothetical protein